jgi:hypothetical protein
MGSQHNDPEAVEHSRFAKFPKIRGIRSKELSDVLTLYLVMFLSRTLGPFLPWRDIKVNCLGRIADRICWK